MRFISFKMGSDQEDLREHANDEGDDSRHEHNESSESVNHPCPRLCHLRRWDDLSYGFNLISKRGKTGHFIDNIEYGLPAYFSGLKNGDRVVEIEGNDISDMAHKEVVKMIKESGSEGIKMLVVDMNTEEYFKEKGFKITSDSSKLRIQFLSCPLEKPELKTDSLRHKPKGKRRASSLFKRFSTPEPPPLDPNTVLEVQTVYSSLNPPEPTPRSKTFINGETPNYNSPAKVSARKTDAKIPLTKNTISHGLPSPSRPQTVINGLPPQRSESPKVQYDQPIARLCHMTKSAHEDFGFVLRTYKDTQEKLIVRLDRNSVAQRTGIREMDHVIEINGVNVAKENHSQACGRIRNHGNELSFLVVADKDMMWFRRQSLVPRAKDCMVFTTRPLGSALKTNNENRDRKSSKIMVTHSQGVPMQPEPGTSASSAASTLKAKDTDSEESTQAEEYQMQQYNTNRSEKDVEIRGSPLNINGNRSNNGNVSTRSSNNPVESEFNDSKLLGALKITASEVRNKIARERGPRRRRESSRVVQEQMI